MDRAVHQYKQLDFWAPDTKFLTDAFNSGVYQTGVPVCTKTPAVHSLLMEDIEENCKSLRFTFIDFKDRVYSDSARYDSTCSVKLNSIHSDMSSGTSFIIIYIADTKVPAEKREYVLSWKSNPTKGGSKSVVWAENEPFPLENVLLRSRVVVEIWKKPFFGGDEFVGNVEFDLFTIYMLQIESGKQSFEVKFAGMNNSKIVNPNLSQKKSKSKSSLSVDIGIKIT